MDKYTQRLPVLPGRGTVTVPSGAKLKDILVCELLTVVGEVSDSYITVNTPEAAAHLECRTIYKKGVTESEAIGNFFIDLNSGEWMMFLPNIMSRPHGLDMKLTFSTKEEMQCPA